MEKAKKQNTTGKWVAELGKYIERMKRMIKEGPKKDIREKEKFLEKARESFQSTMAELEERKQEANEEKNRIREQQSQNEALLKEEYEKVRQTYVFRGSHFLLLIDSPGLPPRRLPENYSG